MGMTRALGHEHFGHESVGIEQRGGQLRAPPYGVRAPAGPRHGVDDDGYAPGHEGVQA
jgi:hypothetical protein